MRFYQKNQHLSQYCSQFHIRPNVTTETERKCCKLINDDIFARLAEKGMILGTKSILKIASYTILTFKKSFDAFINSKSIVYLPLSLHKLVKVANLLKCLTVYLSPITHLIKVDY